VFSHRASILQDAVGETAVALGSDFDLVGSLEQEGLLEVTGSGVHIGDAVLAVVGDVLGCLSGHETQEGQLDVHILWLRALAAILELRKKEKTARITDCNWEGKDTATHYKMYVNATEGQLAKRRNTEKES